MSDFPLQSIAHVISEIMKEHRYFNIMFYCVALNFVIRRPVTFGDAFRNGSHAA